DTCALYSVVPTTGVENALTCSALHGFIWRPCLSRNALTSASATDLVDRTYRVSPDHVALTIVACAPPTSLTRSSATFACCGADSAPNSGTRTMYASCILSSAPRNLNVDTSTLTNPASSTALRTAPAWTGLPNVATMSVPPLKSIEKLSGDPRRK